MSDIRLTIDSDKLDRATKLLAGIPDGMSKALKSAIARTTSTVRSQSSRAISSVYAISINNLRGNVYVRSRQQSSPDGVVGVIQFAGNKIPLFRYDSSPKYPTKDRSRTVHAIIHGGWRTVNPSMAASAHQLRSTGQTRFEHVFVAMMKNGHTGIFERNGGISRTGGDAISEIMGSSYTQMLAKTEVLEEISEKAIETFDKRMEHEITRILNGWGK